MPRKKVSKAKRTPKDVPFPVSVPAPAPVPGPGFFDQVYSGAAQIGQATSMIGAGIGSVFSLILIGIGLYMLWTDPKFRSDLSPTLTPDQFFAESQRYSEAKEQRRKLGWILIIFGFIVLAIVWLYWWFTRKSKAVAALTGGAVVMDLFGIGDE